jgi:hypothetical protein
MLKEPLWKTVLNWGAVITFLTLPLFVFAMQLYMRAHTGTFDSTKPEHFKYLFDFQRNITVLVFGLAGLRTWENITNGKRKSPNEQQRQS